MLGDFVTRILVLLLGYAYPAFECYKTMEKNRVHIEELRFWCQYWVILACLAVFETFGDIFFQWFPGYGEVKLAFIIYLWYPKTKGTSYVYHMLLMPFLAKHDTDIERKMVEWRYRAWDFAIYYWQNCTQLGQSTFVQILQYFAKEGEKANNRIPEKDVHDSPRASKKHSFGLLKSKKASSIHPATPNSDSKRAFF